MADLQEHYNKMIDAMAPLMPKEGQTPEQYAGAMQAFLTCTIEVGARCYHVPPDQAKALVHRAWQFIGTELQKIAASSN